MRPFLIFAILCISVTTSAQLNSWSFREVDSMLKVSPRPVIVFIQTSWCTYCQLMKERTLKDEKIIALLNDQFYFIPFNAEERKVISFRGQRFKYKAYGNNTGLNELAPMLASEKGRLAYPAISVINTKDEIILRKSGFLTAQQLHQLLTGVLSGE